MRRPFWFCPKGRCGGGAEDSSGAGTEDRRGAGLVAVGEWILTTVSRFGAILRAGENQYWYDHGTIMVQSWYNRRQAQTRFSDAELMVFVPRVLIRARARAVLRTPLF